jgi:thiopeptide-type bacteriocin biosynthesis protein
LGRFCHSDPNIDAPVRDYLRREEELTPDVVFAEIVHLPEGRVGNVLLRPKLREYEIPYLGSSGADPENQIPIDDLMVSLKGERVVLRSKRLGREVMPMLTCAHNYSFRSLGTYRFLCTLQHQDGVPNLVWDWGPLESAPFLPRVVHGRCVLQRARWRIQRPELERLGKAQSPFSEVQTWRTQRSLPRRVVLADADNELLVDLDNVLSVESFVQTVKNRPEIRLYEMFPQPERLIASGPEGSFTHEILVPFLANRTPFERPATRVIEGDVARWFGPGSEWMFFKIYTGTSTADLILREVVAPVLRQAESSGILDSWFFIRYSDPEWHIRLRVHGDPQRLSNELLPLLDSMSKPFVESGAIWRVQLDTYEPEVERYGGPHAIELIERIFWADSEAALGIVSLISGDEGNDARWRLALKGADLLLRDFGFDLDSARTTVRAVRDSFSTEFGVTSESTKKIGQRYSKEREALEELLENTDPATSEFGPGIELLLERSRKIEPWVRGLRDLEERQKLNAAISEIVPSIIHMHLNRMLRSAQRAQEMVLYHFLDRFYLSKAARRS